MMVFLSVLPFIALFAIFAIPMWLDSRCQHEWVFLGENKTNIYGTWDKGKTHSDIPVSIIMTRTSECSKCKKLKVTKYNV